jgi:hypothetical protein
MIPKYLKLSTITQIIKKGPNQKKLLLDFARIDYPDPVIREFKGGKKDSHADYNRKQAEKDKR